MTCPECRELLPDVLLDDVPLDDVLLNRASRQVRRGVSEHLAACPDCAREARELQGALLRLAASVARPAPAGLRERLLAAAHAEANARFSHAGANLPLAAAAPEAVLPDVAAWVKRSTPRGATPKGRVVAPPRPKAPRASGSAPRGLLAALALAVAALAAVAQPPHAGASLPLEPPALAANSPAPSVTVVTVLPGGRLVLANSGPHPTLVVQDGPRTVTSAVALAKPAWFTSATLGRDGLVYVSDAANDCVIALDAKAGRVLAIIPAPGGPAATMPGGRGVLVNASSGTLTAFTPGGAAGRTTLAAPASVPVENVMDALLPWGNVTLATHRATGELLVLDRAGSRVVARHYLGGAPVALAAWNGQVLVLDVTGRLLVMNPNSWRVTASVNIGGRPDRLAVSGRTAFTSDRSGALTSLDLTRFTVLARRQVTHGPPMDLKAMPDGHLALAAVGSGVLMLDQNLEWLYSI